MYNSNSRLPAHDGNQCQSLKSTKGLPQPHPISYFSSTRIYIHIIYVFLFTILFAKVLFRDGPHLPWRADSPYSAGHAPDYDTVSPGDRDLGSNVIAFSLSTAKGWRYMFALTPILVAMDLVCLPLLSRA